MVLKAELELISRLLGMHHETLLEPSLNGLFNRMLQKVSLLGVKVGRLIDEVWAVLREVRKFLRR